MPIMLDAVVPWGRSCAEYGDMFMLQSHDLNKTILGCGDGPAAFNAEWSRRGGKVVSVDPIYAFSGEQIARRIQETSHLILDQVRLNLADYHWDSITSPEDLLARRRQAMSDFLGDYPHGLEQQRYVAAELPELGLPDDSFDLALCSHLLFLYSKQLSGAFHLQSLTELLRLAREVRVYPLISLEGSVSPWLSHVIKHFRTQGCTVEIRQVPYRFQRGADSMLSIRRPAHS